MGYIGVISPIDPNLLLTSLDILVLNREGLDKFLGNSKHIHAGFPWGARLFGCWTSIIIATDVLGLAHPL